MDVDCVWERKIRGGTMIKERGEGWGEGDK